MLSSFDGGDAEIGLHGNDDASVLGDNVTHGCIRMDNAEITKLAALLPLGTPVDVAACRSTGHSGVTPRYSAMRRSIAGSSLWSRSNISCVRSTPRRPSSLRSEPL